MTTAAEVLGVRRATLSDLLNSNAALSPEMALRIEMAFGVSMDMLLRMQAWYDALTDARPRRRKSTSNAIGPLDTTGPGGVERRLSRP